MGRSRTRLSKFLALTGERGKLGGVITLLTWMNFKSKISASNSKEFVCVILPLASCPKRKRPRELIKLTNCTPLAPKQSSRKVKLTTQKQTPPAPPPKSHLKLKRRKPEPPKPQQAKCCSTTSWRLEQVSCSFTEPS